MGASRWCLGEEPADAAVGGGGGGDVVDDDHLREPPELPRVASGGRLGNLSSALKAKKDKVETYAVSPKEDEEGVARLATPPKAALNP